MLLLELFFSSNFIVNVLIKRLPHIIRFLMESLESSTTLIEIGPVEGRQLWDNCE